MPLYAVAVTCTIEGKSPDEPMASLSFWEEHGPTEAKLRAVRECEKDGRLVGAKNMVVFACEVPEYGVGVPPAPDETTRVGVSASFLSQAIGILSKHDGPRLWLTTPDGVAVANEFAAGLTIAQRAWQRMPVDPSPPQDYDGDDDVV